MDNQNQGASIEAASHAEFESWWEQEGQYIRAGGGDYEKCFAYAAWNRRTPATQVGAGELPPLPVLPAAHLMLSEQVGSDSYAVFLTAQVQEYARDYARAAIEAASAQQAGAAAPLAGSIAEAIAMRDAEIAALRAQLAAKGQGEPVAYACPAGLERLERVRNGYADSALLVVHANEGGDYTAPLYLAAPASAQPADRECSDCEGSGRISPNELCARCDASGVLPGTQPDQLESAAVPELVKAADALIERWHSRDWKQPHTADFIARLTAAVGAVKFAASPAAQPAKDEQTAPKCWCHTCNKDRTVGGWPYEMTMMILCPTCGNKRCPKATNHALACTNSNEPGQPGSVYGDSANTGADEQKGNQV